MTRFFYTDPLAAAWMAKHFGMRFINGGKQIPPVTYSFLHDDLSGYRLKYAVHSDSLHLLEPQAGDLVAFRDSHAAKVGFIAKRHPDTFTVYGGTMTFETVTSQITRIIQRNGHAFHWPDSEAA